MKGVKRRAVQFRKGGGGLKGRAQKGNNGKGGGRSWMPRKPTPPQNPTFQFNLFFTALGTGKNFNKPVFFWVITVLTSPEDKLKICNAHFGYFTVLESRVKVSVPVTKYLF